jgi:hypothetical protein
MANPSRPVNPIQDLLKFPLMSAIFGRRARRFAMGMEIPSWPLAFRSRHDPTRVSLSSLSANPCLGKYATAGITTAGIAAGAEAISDEHVWTWQNR